MTARDPFRDVVERFLVFEEEAGLWDLEAYGQPYWHQVRYGVQGALVSALALMGARQGNWRSRPLSEWIRPRPSHWKPALERYRWNDMGPADLLVCNHPRHVRHEGRWICPYTEPLLGELPYSRWVIEDVHQGLHYHPTKTEGLKYLEWAWLQANLRYALRDSWRGARLRGPEKQAIRGWVRALGQAFGATLPVSRAVAMVQDAVRDLVAYGDLYQRLLDRVQPKAVVQVVHYSHRNLPLTAVARARGIPTIELQHGVIGAAHLAYNFAPGRRPPGFPSHLATFGDWWRDNTPGLPLTPDKTPAVGYAWLDAHRRRPRRETGGPTLLFVSQGSIGEELSRVAVAAAPELRAAGWTLRYKLHPGEANGWRERYPWLAAAPIDVVDQPTNIYDEFLGATAQAGVYSTALFEGLAFGLRTFLVTLPGWEALGALASSGVAHAVADGPALAAAVASSPATESDPVEALWAEHPQRNMQALLADVVGRQGSRSCG